VLTSAFFLVAAVLIMYVADEQEPLGGWPLKTPD
jgi:hypothetical protein